MDGVVNIEDLRKAAKRRLPRIAFDFIEGGVDDEKGLDGCEGAFRRRELVPRYMVDVSKRDQSAMLFGRSYSSPFGIAGRNESVIVPGRLIALRRGQNRPASSATGITGASIRA